MIVNCSYIHKLIRALKNLIHEDTLIELARVRLAMFAVTRRFRVTGWEAADWKALMNRTSGDDDTEIGWEPIIY